jgi:hypothetical protein
MRMIFATFENTFAEARHNPVTRLINARRLKAAASQSTPAITAYLPPRETGQTEPARLVIGPNSAASSATAGR